MIYEVRKKHVETLCLEERVRAGSGRRRVYSLECSSRRRMRRRVLDSWAPAQRSSRKLRPDWPAQRSGYRAYIGDALGSPHLSCSLPRIPPTPLEIQSTITHNVAVPSKTVFVLVLLDGRPVTATLASGLVYLVSVLVLLLEVSPFNQFLFPGT